MAIVGTRRCTRYGRGLARVYGQACATAGWPVISGLARGADGEAHRGVVDAGGVGVAVLGCGPDIVYPAEHRPLAEGLLAAGGAVVTEYPPGTRPEPWRFPPRNRIIAGLAAAVVVVEAAETGGALITAAAALEQGRHVFAVPGDVGRQTSRGCNLLISDGATPVLDPADLVDSLSLLLGPARGAPAPHPLDAVDAPARALLAAVPPGGATLEAVAAAAGAGDLRGDGGGGPARSGRGAAPRRRPGAARSLPSAVPPGHDEGVTPIPECPDWAAGPVEAYLERLTAQRGLSAHTVEAYQRDLSQFLDFCHRRGHRSLGEIDRVTVRRFLAHLATRGYARASVARKVSAVRAFFTDAARREAVALSPVVGGGLAQAAARLPRVPSVAAWEPGWTASTGPIPCSTRSGPPRSALRERPAGGRSRLPHGERRADALGGARPDPGRREGRQGARRAPLGPGPGRPGAYLAGGRGDLARSGGGTALWVGARAGLWGCGGSAGWCGRGWPPSRMPCATPSPPTFWKVAPTCAPSRNCWDTPAGQHPDLHCRDPPAPQVDL